MRRCDSGRQYINPPNLKGQIEMAFRYRVPLPGPFYYSGRVGPKRWIPRSRSTDAGPMGFVVKRFIVYPSVVSSGLVWLSWSLRSMGCSGGFVVHCGAVRGASRSLSASLFSVPSRGVRRRAPPRGPTASFRLGVRPSLYPMVLFRPNGGARL